MRPAIAAAGDSLVRPLRHRPAVIEIGGVGLSFELQDIR
jgi:hypothetical protein